MIHCQFLLNGKIHQTIYYITHLILFYQTHPLIHAPFCIEFNNSISCNYIAK